MHKALYNINHRRYFYNDAFMSIHGYYSNVNRFKAKLKENNKKGTHHCHRKKRKKAKWALTKVKKNNNVES